MSKSYTIEQLEQMHNFAKEHNMYESSFNPTIQFLRMLKFRELVLLPPRDEKGRFIKPISNEDIYEKLEKLSQSIHPEGRKE